MDDLHVHRKQVKHFHEIGQLHELTFSCYQRRSLLTKDAWRLLLCGAIDRAVERYAGGLAAFVLMPEHVHLLVLPTSVAFSIPSLLQAIKRPYSFQIKRILQQSGNPLLAQLTVQQRPGTMTFRFWQEGPGYDRNITGVRSALAAIDYLHLNPVRRGLCRRAIDWRWSSARWFGSDTADVDSELPRFTPLPPEWLDSPET